MDQIKLRECRWRQSNWAGALAVLSTSMLAACGGSNGPQGQTISGAVAVGLPLSNASVQLMCKTGSTQTRADQSGNYSVRFEFSPPCLISASGTNNGQDITLHSIAPSSGTVNVTPLTELLVTVLSQQVGAQSLDDLASQITNNSAAQNTLTSGTAITNAEAAVMSLVSANGGAVANSTAFLTTPFTAGSHAGADADLDNLAQAGVVDSTTGVPKENVLTAAADVGAQLSRNSNAPVATTALVGGSLSGFASGWDTLTLADNVTDALGISSDGAFSFANPVPLGKPYNVSVAAQPLWQSCSVASGTGIVGGPVSNVGVTCQPDQAQVSTVVNNLPNEGIDGPQAIAFDPTSGNTYVAESNLSVIYVIDPSGQRSVYAGQENKPGNQDGGRLNGATFKYPQGLAVDGQGNLFVADWFSKSIRMISAKTGNVTTIAGPSNTSVVIDAGRCIDGSLATAAFGGPQDLDVDATGANIYVADTPCNSIRKINLAAQTVTTFAGAAPDAGDLNGTALYAGPGGYKDGAGTAALFDQADSLAIGPGGNLYVGDAGNYLIRKITPDGKVTTVAGQPGQPGFRDGATGQTLLGGLLMSSNMQAVPVTYDSATGIANNWKTVSVYAGYAIVKGMKNGLWFADQTNNVVREIDASGNVRTIAGKQIAAVLDAQAGSSAGFWKTIKPQDGVGAGAVFDEPVALTGDPATGNLYVSDFRNGWIRKITPTPANQ